MTSPSHFAERLLGFVVRDPEWREAVIGDLREESARLSARIGATRARRWHTQQSLRIACRYGTHRLLQRGTPPPRWLAIAAQEPGGSWTAGLSRDALYAWRAVGQRPALSTVIVMTLALALAANATTFSLMDAIVLRPYRFAGVDRLLAIASQSPNAPIVERETVTRADFRDWQREAKTVSQLAAFEWWQPNLSGIENPEQVPGFKVSPEFFQPGRRTPVVERTFCREAGSRHQSVVLILGMDAAVCVGSLDRRPHRSARWRILRSRGHCARGVSNAARRASMGMISYDAKVGRAEPTRTSRSSAGSPAARHWRLRAPSSTRSSSGSGRPTPIPTASVKSPSSASRPA